jgi:signal transduction histidine kinase
MLDAFRLHHTVEQREIELPNRRRVYVSLDFIQEKGTRIGALLTMRDAESARRIEDEIELSRRISASGRVTRGVAHEVKNPINAIVLHLQLLRNKMQHADADTNRHVDIIDSEIHRLDRVVQILVDFTRPRDLHLEETDLRLMIDEVALLAAPDAEQHGVKLACELPQSPVPVKVDVDLMKQAILNVVVNGVQAMPNGGTLTIAARRDDETVVLEVKDQGTGIPADLRDKVFELYFTTKKSGTGVGLALTYQVLQWHYGSVDFESAEGKGTSFRLRLPLAETRSPSMEEATARS